MLTIKVSTRQTTITVLFRTTDLIAIGIARKLRSLEKLEQTQFA